MPFLLGFTALCIGARSSSPTSRRSSGVALFIVANFAYQAALIYYDATLKTVSTPQSRGRLSGSAPGSGTAGRCSSGC
jgi:MFS-type transporter involved in bile tolerance (Atg22 family)